MMFNKYIEVQMMFHDVQVSMWLWCGRIFTLFRRSLRSPFTKPRLVAPPLWGHYGWPPEKQPKSIMVFEDQLTMWWKLSALPLGTSLMSPKVCRSYCTAMGWQRRACAVLCRQSSGSGCGKTKRWRLGISHVDIYWLMLRTDPVVPQTATLRMLCCQMWSDTCSDGSRHVG